MRKFVFERDGGRCSIKGCESERNLEIDHIKPVSQDGGDELSNLQPLQWENNRHKGDDWPDWSCLVTS